MEKEKPHDRTRVDAIEERLGHKYVVLDDGFVIVADYMGSDEAIVQAARVSYGTGTKHVHEDRGLIRYLMRHHHTTPFEMCEIKFHVRVPMDVWRQWIRHRTANVNEYSTRYSIAIDVMHRTQPDEWRLQAHQNRQGSQGLLSPDKGQELSQRETKLQDAARAEYEHRLSLGIAREQARKDLPLSTYTEAYWKIDLHNLLHFLELRMDAHAQEEIREYANIIGNEIVSHWCPLAWEAFLDYRLNAVHLSAQEIRLAQALAEGDGTHLLEIVRDLGWMRQTDQGLKPGRELRDFAAKARRLGLGTTLLSELNV